VRRSPFSRLIAVSAAVVLLGASLLGLVSAARAQEEAAGPPVVSALDQQWEDVLLLDALRYLRLSPGQLQQVPPLISVAESRLARLRGQQEPNLAALERMMAKHRSLLMQGKRTPAYEQQNALFLRRTLRAQRLEAIEQVTPFIAARLARIMEAGQVGRAWRLAQGDWPERLPRSPALLALESGFVLGNQERNDLQTGAIRQALARSFPRGLADRLPAGVGDTFFELSVAKGLALRSDIRMVFSDQYPVTGERRNFRVEDTGDGGQMPPTPQEQAHQERLKQIRGQADQLRQRWEQLASQLVDGASQEELDALLVPLARRLLCSPRIVSLLEERLGHGGEAAGEGAGLTLPQREQRLAERWEDVLLLDAMRYLLIPTDQMENILPLARTAQERLAKERSAQAQGAAKLKLAVARERDALLNGQRVPAEEHDQVLAVFRASRERQDAVEVELAKKLAPELAKILSREQVLRAYLLARDEWPQQEARSPMLLDEESRFVLDAGARNQWKEEAVRTVMAHRFGDGDAGEALNSSFATILLDSAVYGKEVRLGTGNAVYLFDAVRTKGVDSVVYFTGKIPPATDSSDLKKRFAPQLVEAAEKERDRLTERWNSLASRLEAGDIMVDELALALRPFVRRAFPSVRFRPVVTERLERGASLPDEELLPAPAPEPQPAPR
jgi:hypothetical protein